MDVNVSKDKIVNHQWILQGKSPQYAQKGKSTRTVLGINSCLRKVDIIKWNLNEA